MMWHCCVTAVMLLVFSSIPQANDGKKRVNPFFAMDTCTKQRYPASDLTIDQQLDLVKELGYSGLSWTEGDAAELLSVMTGVKKRNLRLFAHYAGATLRRDRLEIDPRLVEAMDVLKGSGTLIWLHIASGDFPRSSAEGDEAAVRGLRDLADQAKARELRVALYPHVGDWVERVQDAVRLAEKVGRPNLGVTFNLCHCLKMGDERRIPEILRSARRHLFVVTINGADSGVPEAGWDRLIQTLDRGSMDLAPLFRILRDLPYAGPIGLQGYGLRGNIRDNLSHSMEAWRRLTAIQKGGAGGEKLQREQL